MGTKRVKDTKKVKMSDVKKPAPKKAEHPTFAEMVKTAITTLKEKKGSSRQAISKYICANYRVGPRFAGPLKMALKKGVETGKLQQTKGVGASGSFKVAKVEPEKKPVAKKPAKPAASPKKPASKKVTKKTPTKKAVAPAKKVPAKKAPAKSPKKAAKKPAPAASPKKPVKKVVAAAAAAPKSPVKKTTGKVTKKAPVKKAPAKKTAAKTTKKAK